MANKKVNTKQEVLKRSSKRSVKHTTKKSTMYSGNHSATYSAGIGTTSFSGASSSPSAITMTRRIRTPHAHDVLSGRGGGINCHRGNIQFREWVNERKNDYNLAPCKNAKATVAREVVMRVKKQNPPGRFLQRDPTMPSSGNNVWWVELDDVRIMAKTSQALREGAPQIRKAHQAELQTHKENTPGSSNTTTNSNRKRKSSSEPTTGTVLSAVEVSMRTQQPVLAPLTERSFDTHNKSESKPTFAVTVSPVLSSSKVVAPVTNVVSTVFPTQVENDFQPEAKRVCIVHPTDAASSASSSALVPAANGLGTIEPNSTIEMPVLQLPDPALSVPSLLPIPTISPMDLLATTTNTAASKAIGGMPSQANRGRIQRSHSLALSDIKGGDNWESAEFVNPFASEDEGDDCVPFAPRIGILPMKQQRAASVSSDMGGLGALLKRSSTDTSVDTTATAASSSMSSVVSEEHEKITSFAAPCFTGLETMDANTSSWDYELSDDASLDAAFMSLEQSSIPVSP